MTCTVLKSSTSHSFTGIATDKDDNIYVTDVKKHRLLKLNKDGDEVNTIGSKGSSKGQFKEPRGVAVIDDEVLVCDTCNHRVQVFESDGLELVASFSIPSTYSIAGDELGNIYI